jgi:hypothetical protein
MKQFIGEYNSFCTSFLEESNQATAWKNKSV